MLSRWWWNCTGLKPRHQCCLTVAVRDECVVVRGLVRPRHHTAYTCHKLASGTSPGAICLASIRVAKSLVGGS